MLNRLFLIGLFVCFTACGNAQNESVISTINLKEFSKLTIGKDVQLIDLRTDKEFKNGTIDDAIQMNFFAINTFLKQIETLDKSKEVYVFCHSGSRSKRASKLLAKKGFLKIYDFTGGWKEWSQPH